MTRQTAKITAADPPGTARKSSRAEAKAERRMQLIDATIQCIAKHGLSATTIAKVSEYAGTSIGLANFHFDSKERLLEATLQHLADEERAIWRASAMDASLPPAARLRAIVDGRFHRRVCERRKLAIWFAFWGDAGAREIYRRVLADVDDERLGATIATLSPLCAGIGQGGPDPRGTALGLEAFSDGLWLNMLLYPGEFKRPACRDKALGYLAALFPAELSFRPEGGAANPSNDGSDHA